jgi:hypothetical protein
MSATNQMPLNPQIEEILDEIMEAGGEITPEQERELEGLMSKAKGALDMARAIVALDNYVWVSSRWIENRRRESKRREVLHGMLRSMLPRMFKKSGGKLASPVKDEEISLSYVAAKSTPGPVDPNMPPEVGHRVTKAGYTQEQVEASGIPMTFFQPVTLYVLDTNLVGEYLDHGKEVGPCRRTEPQPYVRLSSSLSLRSADEKKKREERKKRNQFGGGKS